MSNDSLVIVVNNYPYDEELKTAWGFSSFIKFNEYNILFDTGPDGDTLLFNMNKLKIDPLEINFLILSHYHNDHIGGLNFFINKNPDVKIYIPKCFPENFKKDLIKREFKIFENEKKLKISDNIYLMLESNKIIEQHLIIESEKGLIIVTGCAHPGIVKIVNETLDNFQNKIFLLVGGFHLFDKTPDEIENIVNEIYKLDIENISPSHCTGDEAIKLFQEKFKERYIKSGVGKIIYF